MVVVDEAGMKDCGCAGSGCVELVCVERIGLVFVSDSEGV